MAKSSTSWGKFKDECPSCHSKESAGKQRCKCGAMANAEGNAFFKKGVTPPAELPGSSSKPVVEPVKEPVKTATGSSSKNPLRKGARKNATQKSVKSPSRTRQEPAREPVKPVAGKERGFNPFDWLD